MLGQQAGFEGEMLFANNGGEFSSQFALTVTLVVTGTVPTPSPTVQMWADSVTKRYMDLEFIGPAVRYPHAVSIS